MRRTDPDLRRIEERRKALQALERINMTRSENRKGGNNEETTDYAGSVNHTDYASSNHRLPGSSGGVAGASLHRASLDEAGGDIFGESGDKPRYVPSHHEAELIRRFWWKRWNIATRRPD